MSEVIPHEPPLAGSEIDTMIGSLERQRRLVAWKCGGLDAAGMRATTAASTMTLGGLLKHLAVCEEVYFSQRLLGLEPAPPWDTVDWDADPDWEWHSAADDTPSELVGLWEETVARARANLRQVLAKGGLDQPVAYTSSRGQTPSVRRLLIDMIEEYARHLGHVDLIRESVDGLAGEDQPH